MNTSNSPHRICPKGRTPADAARGGFTLVEVMISTLLLTLIGIALLSVLVGAYQVSAKARYRDRARFVIKSFADQFLTQEAIDPASGNVFPLFTITVNTSSGNAMANGTGMVWTNSDGSQGSMSTDSQNAFFYVLLADSTNNGLAITAQVAACVYCPPFSRIPGGYPLM